MKAEAPEKIYISTLNVGDNHYSISKTENPANKKYEVEYIRANAFIDKACEFIETYPHLFMGVLRSEVIEDFKNYIRGE